MVDASSGTGPAGRVGIRNYDWQLLRDVIAATFRAIGSGEREASLVAGHLVEASLTGHDSHGVGLLPGYVDSVRRGDLILNKEISIFLDTGALCVIDGSHGAGQVMAHDAMVLGIARAKAAGSCIVSLRDSHHIGRIGHYAEQCAAEGIVSTHFVNVISNPLVVPFGGTAPRLGTNPFAAGFPGSGGRPPVIVDFATSKLALGKVRVAFNKGVPVAPGVLVDAEGQPTTDPAVMFGSPAGALLPFGEHKGSALSLACELLGAALFGATAQSSRPKDAAILNSMFSVLVDPAKLGLEAVYAERLAAVTAWFQSEAAAGGASVKLPGDPEREMRERRRREGIPVDDTTIAQMRAAVEAAGVAGHGL